MSVDKFFSVPTKKVVCVLRLRNAQKYTGVNLHHILDSFYFLLSKFVKTHAEFDYRFYNLSLFGKKQHMRNLLDIKESDYIIIPTEMEFMYHMKNRAPYFQYVKTWGWVKEIQEVLSDGKKRKVIIITSDKYDTIDLFKDKVFPLDNLEWVRIDESDFVGGLHHLKHTFIQEVFTPEEKIYDFCYWGTYKPDDRAEILKGIKKSSDIRSFFIGAFKGFKQDKKFTNKFIDIVPDISRSRATLCFNTTDKGTTSRYNEALACRVVPLVWKNYDVDNTLVSDEWQRCKTLDDVKEKISQLSDDTFYQKKMNEISKNYYQKTMSVDSYISQFDSKLISNLNG